MYKICFKIGTIKVLKKILFPFLGKCGMVLNINGGINRGNAQPVARRTIFGERSEQVRRTILASEASRSENDFGERNEVYSIHRKYLASEASRSENSFGE